MKLFQIPSMSFALHAGREDSNRNRRSIVALLTALVLLTALIPPAMVGYAGGNYHDSFALSTSADSWHIDARLLYLGELFTVPLMAWFIHLTCRANNIAIDYYRSFIVAALATLPMWIFSVVLLVPNLIVFTVVEIIALLCSFAIVYRGVSVLLRVHEELQAVQMAMVTVGFVLLAWLLWMQVLLIH